MSGEEMPKRGRADSPSDAPARTTEVNEVTDSPPSTPPVEVAEVAEVIDVTPPNAERDPVLERQLDALDVDEDFRESIRAMTPNTRRDVLNDIIRHQQHTGIEENLHTLGVSRALGGPIFTFSSDAGIYDDDDGDHSEDREWADEEEEEREDDREAQHSDDDASYNYARSPFMFGQRAMGPHDDDDDHSPARSNVRIFSEQEGGSMNVVDFLQFVSQHIQRQPSGPPQRSTRGRAAQPPQQRSILEERMLSLQNLIGMLQQANAMQSMGLHRDVDDMSYEELLELEERIGNVSKGVPPALLESCMTRVDPAPTDGTCPVCQEELVMTAAVAPPPPSSTSRRNSSANASKVCVKLLNCPHVFHKSCIAQWLAGNKTCPVCKQEVLPQADGTSL